MMYQQQPQQQVIYQQQPQGQNVVYYNAGAQQQPAQMQQPVQQTQINDQNVDTPNGYNTTEQMWSMPSHF